MTRIFGPIIAGVTFVTAPYAWGAGSPTTAETLLILCLTAVAFTAVAHAMIRRFATAELRERRAAAQSTRRPPAIGGHR